MLTRLAAAVIKDTVYMDGGFLYWIPGMQTGEYGAPTQDGKIWLRLRHLPLVKLSHVLTVKQATLSGLYTRSTSAHPSM